MTTDEIFKNTPLMDKPESEEDYLNIDWNTRLITIPSTLTNIGVYNDKDTNRLYFRCPIEYGEFRIADFGVHVNYQNTGISTTKHDGDVYFVDDVESDGNYLTFSWLVGRHAYLEQGTTAFIVCCKVVDSDDNVVNELNTTLAILDVLEGLEVDVLPPEDYPDYLEEILKRCEQAEETAQEAKDAVQSAQDTADEALTKANEVADSAITGINVNGTPAEVKDHIAEVVTEDSGNVCYGVCDTDADEGDKEATAEGFDLVVGEILAVRFTNGNTEAKISMNVNDSNFYGVTGDARCPENSIVFFVYVSHQDFIVDAGLTRANEANDAVPTKVSQLDNDSGYITESDVPTKVSELENDSGYITNDALDGYAKEDDIPTKTSELTNDSGYITDSAVESVKETADSALEKATEAKEAIPTKVSELDNDSGYITEDALDDYAKEIDAEVGNVQEAVDALKDSAITGITVNGTEQPVNNNIAELAIEESNGSVYFAYVTDDSFVRSSELNLTLDGFKYEQGAVLNLVFDCESERLVDYIMINRDEGFDIRERFYIKSGLVTLVYKGVWRTTKLLQDAITSITVNGEDVPVENNKAEIEFDDVSNGSDGIKALTVDGDLFEYVNEICDTIGVYFMRATSDTPNIPETAAFFIMLLRNSNTQATMIAFRAGSNTNTYMCKEQASSWGDWTQIIPASGGEAPIEHIAVNGEEQPIEDKTVDLSIDRASVDGETLVVGDTAGGGGLSGVEVLTGEVQGSNRVTFTGKRGFVMCTTLDDEGCGLMLMGNGKTVPLGDGFYKSTASGDEYTLWNEDGDGIGYIAIIMEG